MIRLTCILASILTVAILTVAVNVTSDATEAQATQTIRLTATPTAKPTPTQTVTAKPTVKPTPKSTTKPVASSDLDLLARVVMAEAGGECDEMQLLVANVVINRMRDRRFPSTLRGVIYQRGQYACVGVLGRVKPSSRAVKNAKRVLAGERFCPAKVVWQAEFRQGRGVWKRVGNQYFCY